LRKPQGALARRARATLQDGDRDPPGVAARARGGPVGLEFAQIFGRFGSSVTLVQGAARISPRSDDDAAAELSAALRAEGVELVTGTTVERLEGKRAVLANGG
jgi:NADPH-dependent 2,4-dienoyl-CoA reductase/sulfur reductase-like enzyme